MKVTIRKMAELGIGMTAIAALILAGCGGGGGGSSGGSLGSSVNITPSLGQFKEGSHVKVYNKSNSQIASGLINASGVAAVTFPAGETGPFLVCAGYNGDQYYDEKTNVFQTISGVSATVGAMRAIVPNNTYSSVGVTPLTEMAAALLTNASGVLPAGVTAASAVGANATIAANVATKLGLPQGANILTPPTPVVANGTSLGTTDGDQYAKVLHTLAHLDAYGSNPLEIARRMREDAEDGKFDGRVGATTVTTTLNQVIATASTTAQSKYSGTAPTRTDIDYSLDLKVAMEAAEVENEDMAEMAAATFSTVFAASGVNAATAAAASAVTNAAAAATPIASAKALVTSLRTNANLLHNSGKTGFIDTQVSAAQAEYASMQVALHGLTKMQSALEDGMNLLRNNASVGTLAPAGQFWSETPCAVTATDTVVCQWQTEASQRWATHQLTITKGTAANTYNWSETLIGYGTLPCNSSGCSGTLTITGVMWPTIWSGSMTGPVMGSAGTPLVAAQTGTATAVYDINVDGWALVTLSGNMQPGSVPTSSHHRTSINLSNSESRAGNQISFAFSGTLIALDAANNPALTLTIKPGSTGADEMSTSNTIGGTVSLHVVVEGKTATFQFDGVMDMSDYAYDLDNVGYTKTNTFTGSITNIANASVGKFMEGTLSLSLDGSAYHSLQPWSPTNFEKSTTAFTGSITNRTVSPAMAYQVSLSSSQQTSGDTMSTTLTYTDPSGKVVTLTETDVNDVTTASTIQSGGISVANGNVYSGNATTGTLIGTISGPIVNFIDGSFVSFQ